MNDLTKTQMRNVLQLAMLDPIVRQLEPLYRNADDAEEGALCLALVIEQGADRFGIQIDQDALVAAINERWGRVQS